MESDCIFCKIINKEIPANIIAENENVFVIKDIAPKAPIHYLIIPKKHIVDVGKLEVSDKAIAADLLLMAQQLSKSTDKAQAFKLISNNGSAAGQEVFHIHLHFLAGRTLPAN